VNAIIGTFLAFFLTAISQFNSTLEKSFIQNDSQLLSRILPQSTPLLLTLPEPLNISDCFSPEQSIIITQRIFKQITTLEFFIDQENPVIFGRNGVIIQARWSFLNKISSRKYILRLYFYVYPEKNPSKNTSALKIREIRAEKR
jgi:hypothetical protein